MPTVRIATAMLESEDLDVVNVHTELKGVGKTEYEEVP